MTTCHLCGRAENPLDERQWTRVLGDGSESGWRCPDCDPKIIRQQLEACTAERNAAWQAAAGAQEQLAAAQAALAASQANARRQCERADELDFSYKRLQEARAADQETSRGICERFRQDTVQAQAALAAEREAHKQTRAVLTPVVGLARERGWFDAPSMSLRDFLWESLATLATDVEAAQHELAAEREAHEKTRRERDRACAEQVVAHACMVDAFSAKLQAEADAHLWRRRAQDALAAFEGARAERDTALAALAEARGERDSYVAAYNEQRDELKAARAALDAAVVVVDRARRVAALDGEDAIPRHAQALLQRALQGYDLKRAALPSR
jgi:hypothetical protein